MNIDQVSNVGLLTVSITPLIDALEMPVYMFPKFESCGHELRDDWVSVMAGYAVTVELGDNVEQLLSSLFEQTALDLLELIVDGDTESSDPYIALMDGLKKRTTWPERFLISSRVEVAACDDAVLGELSHKFTFFIAAE